MEWTVVRLYGSFAWPPLPGAKAEIDPAEGTIEFGYVDLAAPLGRQPFMRWIPRHDAPPPPLSGVTKNISAFDAGDRAARQTRVGFAYLLGKAQPLTTPAAPAYLRFRGAALFEQCRELETIPSQPMMRWLLASRYDRDGSEQTSEVLVGLKGDAPKLNGSSFALALALPTPVPLSVSNDKECRAFPFVARYQPAVTKFDPTKPLDAFSVASGTFDELSPAATLAALNPSLHANHLGGFGFCRTDGGADALYLPRFQHSESQPNPPLPKSETIEKSRRRSRDKLWLSNKALIAKEIFSKLLGSDPGLANMFATVETGTRIVPNEPSFSYEVTEKGELRNSIYFSSAPDGSRTTMRFRHAIEATGLFTKGPLDIERHHSAYQFKFDVPELGGTPLQSNSPHLIAEFILDYQIPDDAVWDAVLGERRETGASFPDIGLTALCGFKGITANFALGGADADSNGAAMLFRTPAAAAKAAREALRRTDGAQPDSILPDIVFAAGTPFRLAYVPALKVALDRSAGAHLSWQVADRERDGRFARLTLWPEPQQRAGIASDAPPLFQSEAYGLPVSLAFPALEREGETPIKALLVHDGAALGRMDHEGFPVSVRIVPGANSDALPTRLGGLGFQFAAPVLRSPTQKGIPPETGDDYSVWRFDAGDPVASAAGESRHMLRLRFVASAIDPLAPDTPRGDRSGRPRPLLLPLQTARAGDGSAIPYMVDMRETIGARADRLLTADVFDLRDDGAPPTPDRYVLLSEQPFSISRFEVLPLKQRGSAEKGAVASYSSDRRSWSFKQVSEHYHYAFPAQAIGESMDKPRRLEIHDPAEDVPDTEVLPYPPGETTPTAAAPLARRHIVDYRLTPSAEIWIRPSDVEQGFFRPEWATHALFREPGALGIGAALAAFRGEFLYGMPTGVDVSRERGAAGDARVAEVEALVGRPLGAIASAAVAPEISERWGRISTMIARRPERLEFWMRAPGSSRTFTPARFGEGVTFALRDSAVVQPPLLSPLIDEDKSVGPRLRDHGLAGGAIWPLESALFTQRLLEAPLSSAGTIERVALSPLGGDADQRGEFLAGQLAIISETRGGRVQRHRVEIIGRIAVFWHRAKHVVIYERTTSPTQQFGPEGGMGTRSRRPILRKVSEFIELIEPVRSYPDDQAADAMTSGFLKAVRFNSKVIAVDSAWSDDIPEAGWRIPLWNRHAARQRPSVYPRPDIVTVTAAEGPEEQPVIAQEFLDPDNLYFFADSVEGHADTDRWPARAGIDFTKMPAPRHRQQPRDSADAAGRTGGRSPSAPRIPRGQRRFTWQLGPAARKTAVNAGRAEEPIFAALETISFQRATQLRSEKGLEERERIEGLMTTAGAFVSDKALEQTLAAFARAAADPNATKTLIDSASDLATALDAAIKGRHDKLIGGFDDLLTKGPGACDKMLGQITSGIERQRLMIVDAVRTWQADAAQAIAAAAPPTRKEAVDVALARLDEVVAPLLDGAANEVGRIGEGAARARDAVATAELDFQEMIAKARQKLAALKASYDRSKPWSAARVTEIHARLQDVRDGLIGDLEAAAGDARGRLATELDGLARRLGVEVGTRVTALLAKATELKALAERQAGAVEDWLRAIEAPLGRMLLPAGPLDKAREAIEKLPPERVDLKEKALALLANATARAKEAQDLVVDVQAGLAKGRLDADKAVARVQVEVAAKRAEAAAMLAELHEAIDTLGKPEEQAIKAEILAAGAEAERLIDHLADMGKMVDALIDETEAAATAFLAIVSDEIADIFGHIKDTEKDVSEKLVEIQKALRPGGDQSLYRILQDKVLRPALHDNFAILDEIGAPQVDRLERALDGVGDAVEKRIENFAADAQAEIDKLGGKVRDLCGELGTSLESAVKDLTGWADDLVTKASRLLADVKGALADAKKLRELADQILADGEAARKALEQSWVAASAYADNVFHAAGQIGKGDLAAAPAQLLRLYAAAASAPALPNLDFARERLGYYYDELNKVIDTTPAEAWFGRLGEELKAMGLSLPFDKLGDRLLPDDLSKYDIGKIFKNFGGIDLSRLFKGVKLPQSATNAIKLTHAFDKKQARAWVQIDIDVPLPGRRPLLGVGPFTLDFVDARLAGVLRLEASKDSDTVEQTGRAELLTDIDAVVSGQSMVRLEKLVIHYQKSSGLKVDFDPRNIKINPALRFVQETLGQIFPDTVGGLKIIKEQGIPVGVSHDFAMPPINLMAGTSGVSNIAISNHFSLIAYPDFIIADRFCLSRPDLPFLFSIFIIGGTGYIQVDVDYRPFSNALMVTVEAAAGGSAALGFAAGPVSGSVFITLSVALSYRKLVGRPGGGLTIACVLLIAGSVDVAGIATVYMGLLLRMNYRENGQIDGVGTLKITIRVSRFFKYTVRRDVTYKLRSGGGGRSAALPANTAATAAKAQAKADKILDARS